MARSLDRLRGFDRFLALAEALLRARPDVLVVVAGDPVVRRGLDVAFHNQDYRAHLTAQPPAGGSRAALVPGRGAAGDRGRAALPPATCTSLRGGSIPWHDRRSRPWPPGCVVLASDHAPHREVIEPGRTGLLVDPGDADGLLRQALAVLDDPAGHRPLGEAAADLVRQPYSQDACLPRLAEQFNRLALPGGRRP